MRFSSESQDYGRPLSESRFPSRALVGGGPRVLEWYPKPHGVGDIDGEGAQQILGRPTLEQHEVLIRETAQNSWDARLGSDAISFSVNMRKLDTEKVRMLRERVFTGEALGTGLVELLNKESIWVLEVNDRGTSGLDGPTRTDQVIPDSESKNFINFVFTIGAAQEAEFGGGTYGFGKTISYATSAVGAVLIWTRCRSQGALQYRLIGSAMGRGFNRGGRRYTGRHWWGVHSEDRSRVEPLVGSPAQELGDALFATRFEGATTGTSLMILAPDNLRRVLQEKENILSAGVTKNLWPKLLQQQADQSAMQICISVEDVAQELPTVDSDPVLTAQAACLQAVRDAQQGSMAASDPRIVPKPIKWRSSIVGHLALQRFFAPGLSQQDLKRVDSVTLMRNRAELVVRTTAEYPLDVDGFHWVGVFKPTADFDRSFAESEPPAHDDWTPDIITDDTMRSHVVTALRKIRQEARDFANPSEEQPFQGGQVESVAAVGNALAALIPGVGGSAPEPSGNAQASQSKSPRGRSRAGVEISDAGSERAADEGWTRRWVSIRLAESTHGEQVVRPKIQVGTDGKSVLDDTVVRILGWLDSESGAFLEQAVSLKPGEERRFGFETWSSVVVHVRADIVSPSEIEKGA